MKKCFIPQFNSTLLHLTKLSEKGLEDQLKMQIAAISERGKRERSFWVEEIQRMDLYSREEAISELIKAKKIHEKIAQINAYIRGLQV